MGRRETIILFCVIFRLPCLSLRLTGAAVPTVHFCPLLESGIS